MARSAKRRGRKQPAKKRAKVRKIAKRKAVAKRAKRKAARRKAAKRTSAKRKPAKRKAPKSAPAYRDEPWPMIFAVVVALLVGLVAIWQFGGAPTAANAAAPMPLMAADTASFLAIGDYGCGGAVAGDTWLMVAYPELAPVLR